MHNFPFDSQDLLIQWEFFHNFYVCWNRIKIVPCHVSQWGALTLSVKDSNSLMGWNLEQVRNIIFNDFYLEIFFVTS